MTWKSLFSILVRKFYYTLRLKNDVEYLDFKISEATLNNKKQLPKLVIRTTDKYYDPDRRKKIIHRNSLRSTA